MSKRYVTVSDLSGKPIDDDGDVVTMVVLDHPRIEAPIQLDASRHEVEQVQGSEKDYAVIELLSDGGNKKERVVLDLSQFDKLFSTDVNDTLASAEKYMTDMPVRQPEALRARSPRTATRATSDKVNYKELPHAGMPHRGRTTDEEAATVRANLDAVNEYRIAAGHPPIDPQNEKDAARYGFDQQKPEDRPKLSPQFTG